MKFSIHRRMRFGLRTAIVSLTFAAIWLGWLTEQARRQRVAVAWVRHCGGQVRYDFEQLSRGRRPDSGLDSAWNWLRDSIGVDYFATVVSVTLDHNEIADLSPIAEFKELQSLGLMTSVNAGVDLSVLARLEKLEELRLDHTRIDPKKLRGVMEALPNCRITSATDPALAALGE